MVRAAVVRHPLYSFTLLALALCTFWFILSRPSPRSVFYSVNHHLSLTLNREERKYHAMLTQRRDLIRRFGPDPSQVAMFPLDQEPWPPYTVWDFFPAIFNCPHEVDRIGALGDGGKWFCGLSRIQDKPDCIMYSFGVDSSYSLEREVLQSTRFCQAWIYDSTKGDSAETQFPLFLRNRVHFGKLAIGASDHHGRGDDPQTWTLKSLMEKNGHSFIDFLRLDVEGWEWDSFRAIVNDFTTERAPRTTTPPSTSSTPAIWTVPERDGVLPFGQLQIELHVWNQRFQDFLEWWELLEVAGLRPFHCEINLVYANYNRHSGVQLAEYSFLNVRGNNSFVKDYALHPTARNAGVLAAEEGVVPEGQ